jgi:hypothetical protein
MVTAIIGCGTRTSSNTLTVLIDIERLFDYNPRQENARACYEHLGRGQYLLRRYRRE